MEAEALESGGGERQGSIYVRIYEHISVSVAERQPGSIQPNKLLWKCLGAYVPTVKLLAPFPKHTPGFRKPFRRISFLFIILSQEQVGFGSFKILTALFQVRLACS